MLLKEDSFLSPIRNIYLHRLSYLPQTNYYQLLFFLLYSLDQTNNEYYSTCYIAFSEVFEKAHLPHR